MSSYSKLDYWCGPICSFCSCFEMRQYLGLCFASNLLMDCHRFGIKSLLQCQTPSQAGAAVSTSARCHWLCLSAQERNVNQGEVGTLPCFTLVNASCPGFEHIINQGKYSVGLLDIKLQCSHWKQNPNNPS